MKKKLQNFIKYNHAVYLIYYYVMCFFIRLLGLFVRTDDRLILFNSFAGRKYDDSPKVLFEEIKKDSRFKDYSFVWAFHDPDRFQVDGAKKIRMDGFSYFKTALKAKIWITNSSVERGLKFKKKNTLYVNTWHGTPIKKMGTDIGAVNTSFKPKGESPFTAMNSQGTFDTDVFSRAFGIPREKFLEVGLPRNDVLDHYTREYRDQIRDKLNIPRDKKVILYCPTFREYEKDESYGVVMAPPMDLKLWERELKDKYVLLMRAHYEVAKVMKIDDGEFVRDMTDYPSLNELFIASDLLVSDYSSVYFDYSIMDKPMLHFAYDYDKYQAKRGMYFDIRDYLTGADNEQALIGLLKGIDLTAETEKTVKFRNTYVNFHGEAGSKTVDWIAAHK